MSTITIDLGRKEERTRRAHDASMRVKLKTNATYLTQGSAVNGVGDSDQCDQWVRHSQSVICMSVHVSVITLCL
jgi:hypothetical protein